MTNKPFTVICHLGDTDPEVIQVKAVNEEQAEIKAHRRIRRGYKVTKKTEVYTDFMFAGHPELLFPQHA